MLLQVDTEHWAVSRGLCHTFFFVTLIRGQKSRDAVPLKQDFCDGAAAVGVEGMSGGPTQINFLGQIPSGL